MANEYRAREEIYILLDAADQADEIKTTLMILFGEEKSVS
jgi:hypothetical protein